MSQTRAVVDQLLTQAILGYVPKGFIAEDVFTPLKHTQSTGLLPKIGTSHLRIENTRKAGRGKYRRVEGVTRSTTQFKIDGHGLEAIVTPDDYANVNKPYDAEKEQAMANITMIKLEREKAVADQLSNTANLTQNVTLAGNQQFSDYDNSDPIAKFNTARETVVDGCGLAPDTVIMSWKVKNKLKFHPQLLDLLGYKYNRPGGLKDQELADVLEVERILIGNSVYESAKEGQTSSLAQVWGKHIIFGVLPTNPALYQVSGGYTVRRTDQSPQKVYKYPIDNPPESNALLVEDCYDDLISQVGALYLIKNAIA